MISFSFTVGSADDARTAAEVCDFLAEQLTATKRRPRASDPAELYASMAAPHEDRLVMVRELVKERGGKWWSDYMKSINTDKPLSAFTDDELSALHAAAVAA
jgi:hypothetical protein